MPSEESRPAIASNDIYRDIGREIATRLQLRTQILFGFVTVSSTLIATSLAQPAFNYLDISVGFLAFFTGALSAHHEIIMANLKLYQKMLIEDANPRLASSWMHFQTEKLVQGQRLSDWTQLFLYLVLGIAALSATSFPLAGLKQIFFWMSATCFGLSLVCIIYGWKKRKKIDLQQPQPISI
ncbi:hypothetical protein KDA_72580 [Dictyobacter alpinus]|uniref:Uncharacterized protein n=1 Tax=Dictyobacter alpinus TaxID=2014873 RepID=A0A402BKA5_9CHLR|nr:hypothetical protein [Dictyobacter alpinus]GCE31774.1 hypothetical protein KDA_72580 [Dictyobacter alpinus]